MRVLWFEVTVPKNYSSHNFHGAGWQDALEYIVKQNKDIELGIAFESNSINNTKKLIDGVEYFPLNTSYNFIEKLKNKFTWEVSRNKIIEISLKVIEEFKPDIIHVFGSEWCFGQVAEYTSVPVIIHMQGSIPPYINAFYPPGYNEWTEWIYSFINFKLQSLIKLPLSWKKRKAWVLQEEKTLKLVKNYMGRTDWDKNIVLLYNQEASYFCCNEALRPAFIQLNRVWQIPTNNKLILATVGCSSFWKGLDTIVRTAKLLKERNIDFEWRLVGKINHKELIEWKEKTQMKDVNIHLMGMLDVNELIELLINTDIYVHTAYIDNSPNSICEAQYIGLPIIATYVGGIPSLIENGKEGLLVPANAPYTLATEIMKLANDKQRLFLYSENSKKRARERHNPEEILKSVLKIYSILLQEKGETFD
jgi:glycosyltransferase involved in cell wall biosynthesis